MKILILKPSSLGDVVQALPVLRLLKRWQPHSEIHWWLAADLVPLLEDDPDLTGVFCFDRRRWASPLHWDEMLQSIRAMRAQRFDWVIDLQALLRSGLFAWLANGSLIVGLDDDRERAPGFYDVRVPRASYHTHAVDWYLSVLTALKVPVAWNFEWLPPRPKAAAAIRTRWPDASERWLALQPGARWPNKRWPAGHFADLVRRLAATDPRRRFALLGGKDDQPLGHEIARVAPERCVDLTGRTTLPEMVEWLRRCDLMVTNDTGPMHVAAALGKPLVTLFGPTEPRRTGPYGQLEAALQHRLPCAPCMASQCRWPTPMECLQGLSVTEVEQAVEARLARSLSDTRQGGAMPGHNETTRLSGSPATAVSSG